MRAKKKKLGRWPLVGFVAQHSNYNLYCFITKSWLAYLYTLEQYLV